MNTSLEILAEFIAPFEDDLNVCFLGDNLTTETIKLFSNAINKTRKSIPEKLPPVKFNNCNTSDLFRGKYKNLLDNKCCIQYLDINLSYNVISYLTNELDDEMEGMLIDKHILQVNQEKYIFDITNVSDDTLAILCQNMDNRYGSYNYYITENFLAVWVYYTDEFSRIQDL